MQGRKWQTFSQDHSWFQQGFFKYGDQLGPIN